MKTATLPVRNAHVTHGCPDAPVSVDNVQRHNFTTMESMDPAAGHIKRTECRYCHWVPVP